MDAELRRLGHPMLAALLSMSLTAPIEAETGTSEMTESVPESHLSQELELMREEESIGIVPDDPRSSSLRPPQTYVVTEGEISLTRTADIPMLLRCCPGTEVMRLGTPDFNVSLWGFPKPGQTVGIDTVLNLRDSYGFWKERGSWGYFCEADIVPAAVTAFVDNPKEFPSRRNIGRRLMGWLTVR